MTRRTSRLAANKRSGGGQQDSPSRQGRDCEQPGQRLDPSGGRVAQPNAGLNRSDPGSAAITSTEESLEKTAAGRFRASTRLVGAQPKIQGWWPVLLLTGLSLAACCLMFPSVGWWWVAYGALVPWLVCVCTARRSRLVYLASFLFGLGFFLINCYWLFAVTPPGYFALCLYYAVFFPLVAWPVRHMYVRHGVSAALTAPIAWVAAEYLRSVAVLGFPWLLLGHSQYQNLTMIQISDLVGAYGVSFVLAMVNGWITDLLIQPILIWRSDEGTRLPIGSLTTLLVVLGTVIYGSTQRSKAFFQPGPKIAVVQHDFPMYVDEERAGRTSNDMIFRSYLELARQAAAQKPDLIVLPETIVSGYLNQEFLNASPTELDEIRRRRFPPGFALSYLSYVQRISRQTLDAFQQLSTQSGVPILFGSLSIEWRPTAIPPRVDAFNSALLLRPGEAKPVGRYDKIHLVLFGEYVPFRLSYRPLYEWLNSKTPWGRMGIEYSLTAGADYHVFEFSAASQGGRPYRAAVPICYEEIMPYIAREFTRGEGDLETRKNIDLLISISNDGWFLHTTELEQHLAAAVFRAVENRIPIARSVNTGASGVVHPNGKIHMRVAMPAERLALLDPIAGALRKLDALAQKMETEVEVEEAYSSARNEFGQTFGNDFSQALNALGNEFLYIRDRLAALLAALPTTSPRYRRQALAQCRSQLEEDLQTLARWKDKPWTAPGFSIAQAQCDGRVTIYTRWGDWFAQGTVALMAVMLLDWLLRRFRRLSAAAKAKDGKRG
jgi:apolipoprotein N-acyltransferase